MSAILPKQDSVSVLSGHRNNPDIPVHYVQEAEVTQFQQPQPTRPGLPNMRRSRVFGQGEDFSQGVVNVIRGETHTLYILRGSSTGGDFMTRVLLNQRDIKDGSYGFA